MVEEEEEQPQHQEQARRHPKSPRYTRLEHFGLDPLTHVQADWSEGLRKKKSAGVPDMTLLSTITNEEINKNLKERFFNQEIYVG